MRIAIFDIESTTKKSFGWKIGNPHDDNNYIVCYCIIPNDQDISLFDYTTTPTIEFENTLRQRIEATDMLVCHNANFDILFLYIKYQWFRDWILQGGRVWCTQLANYLLSGQREPMVSLNTLSARYGGSQKNDIIADYWAQGLETTEIPKDTLIEYNIADVVNTKLVFNSQLALLKKKGLLELANRQMEDLLFLILCEYNGMHVDLDVAKEARDLCNNELRGYENKLLDQIKAEFPEVPTIVWNLASKEQMSAILFGGVIKYKERGPILDDDGNPTIIKSKTSIHYGEVKTKIYERKIYIKGFGIVPKEQWKLKKDGYFATNGDVIKVLIGDSDFIKLLKKYRKLEKLRDSYYKALPDLRYEKDSCVHPTFNTTQITGRTAATNPSITITPRE